MAEMLHTVYRGLPGETTQWDDIQRKLGNLPPKAPVWKPEKYTPEQEEKRDAAWLAGRDAEELGSDLEDEFTDDRFLEQYRLKRIKELQEAARRPRFGTVELIRGSEFVQKVTEASRGTTAATPDASSNAAAAAAGLGDAGADSETGRGPANSSSRPGVEGEGGQQGPGSSSQEGIWVVCQLFKEGHGPSELMTRAIDDLARRYPSTKFVRIVSTDCIPGYPDTNLPTLLVYHGGSCIKHLVGLSALGGPRTTPEQVALVLNMLGPVCSSGADDDEGGGDGEAGLRGEDARLVKRLVQRVVAQREEGDESSDFDD